MCPKQRLSKEQKEKLHKLEADLTSATMSHNFSRARNAINEAHRLLKPLGQNCRLAVIKCRYCEFLINEQKEQDAILILNGIRQILNKTTRGYLEATALLAICYLRQGEIVTAKPFMKEVLSNDSVIKSDFQRRQFQKIILQRFDEETVIAALRNDSLTEKIDANELLQKAGYLLYESGGNEDNLNEMIGEQTPIIVKQMLYDIEVYSQKQLPYKDTLMLPSPDRFQKNRETGKIVGDAIKKSLHKCLCDPECETHQMFVKFGFNSVLNKLTLPLAISTCLYDLKMGLLSLAIPVTALVIKLGIDTYCELYPFDSIMEQRKSKNNSHNDTIDL